MFCSIYITSILTLYNRRIFIFFSYNAYEDNYYNNDKKAWCVTQCSDNFIRPRPFLYTLFSFSLHFFMYILTFTKRFTATIQITIFDEYHLMYPIFWRQLKLHDRWMVHEKMSWTENLTMHSSVNPLQFRTFCHFCCPLWEDNWKNKKACPKCTGRMWYLEYDIQFGCFRKN